MEKEFIHYEQALELKELGFNEPCLGYYTGDKKHLVIRPNMGRQNEELNYIVCTAPTFSQAFRWFREKCGLNSHIHQENRDEYSYCCGQGYSDEIGGYLGFETYEEAELECLKKLIETTKNK